MILYVLVLVTDVELSDIATIKYSQNIAAFTTEEVCKNEIKHLQDGKDFDYFIHLECKPLELKE